MGATRKGKHEWHLRYALKEFLCVWCPEEFYVRCSEFSEVRCPEDFYVQTSEVSDAPVLRGVLLRSSLALASRYADGVETVDGSGGDGIADCRERQGRCGPEGPVCPLPAPAASPDPCCKRFPRSLTARAVGRYKHAVATSEKETIPQSSIPFPSRVTAMSIYSLGKRGNRSRAAFPGTPSLLPVTIASRAVTVTPSWGELLPDSKTSLHFAYGQGLHFETLKSSGVKFLSAKRSPETSMFRVGSWSSPPGSIVLSASASSPPPSRVAVPLQSHAGGQATLQQLKQGEAPKYTPYGHRVHGVLYRMTKKDMARLADHKEGYHLQRFEVELYDGRIANALAFVSSPHELLPQEVVPPEGYMKLLREGSADQVIDPIYQAWLSSIDTVCGCGLGPDYFNTQSTHMMIGLGIFASISMLAACFLLLFP
eukprot:gene25203-10845_t